MTRSTRLPMPDGRGIGTLRVLQLGDVAGVAGVLQRSMDDGISMLRLNIPQPGARWPPALKPLAIPFRLLAAGLTAWRIRRLRPDIVHVHWVPNGFAAVLAGYPFLLHAHGDDVRNVVGWRRPLTRWLLKRAHLVVYSTPDLAQWVDGVWLPNPVIPVDGQTSAQKRILIGSRAEPSKGREVAIAAAARIPPRISVDALFGLDLAGAPNITVLGEMPSHRFRRTLAGHEVLWGQFKLGALGLTELEAMSAGCAVVCWVSDETTRAYGENVPVISTRDPDVIAAETLKLLDDPKAREDLGSAARSFVERWHAPARIGKQLAEIYRFVAQSHQDRPR